MTEYTRCEELTHWKRPWCWERLRAGGEGDNRGWDGWMASSTQWTWVWMDYGSWWWTERPGVLRFMGSQRVGHDWVTELNWTELNELEKNEDQTKWKRTELSKVAMELKPLYHCFMWNFRFPIILWWGLIGWHIIHLLYHMLILRMRVNTTTMF